MRDADYEQRSGYSIDDALTRAKENKGLLLRGFSIYCTEGVHGGFDTYKAITEANGGKCFLYRARAGVNQTLRAGSAESPSDAESDEPLDVFLLSSTTPEDAKLWSRFRQMVEANGKTPRIVRHDWLLTLALSQQIEPNDSFQLTEMDVNDAGA